MTQASNIVQEPPTKLLEAHVSHRTTEKADIAFLFSILSIEAPSDEQLQHAFSFRKQIFAVGVNTGWDAAKSEILRLEARVKELEEGIHSTRSQTIEECAKVAESMKSGPVYFVDGKPNAGVVVGGENIAKAIRSLDSNEAREAFLKAKGE